MKNLLVMRHAKSDWTNSSISDFERPLNHRGIKSAPLMGNELLKKGLIPDLIISSPANRAKTTAEMAAKACNYNSEIRFEQEFYFGSIEGIINIIKNSNNLYEKIMIVGHNPTSESLIYKLLKNQNHQTMSTAAIASLIFDVDKWKDIKPQSAILEWVIAPKDITE